MEIHNYDKLKQFDGVYFGIFQRNLAFKNLQKVNI